MRERERHSRRLKVKRAQELELVVVDKRAKRKESRVLDSNGESGALGGLCPVRGEGVGGASVMNFNGKSTPPHPVEESAWLDKRDFP